MSRATIEQAIELLANGKAVILVDDENRENEGDICLLAENVRAEDINFMVTHARGLVCLTVTKEWAEHLKLPPMAERNTSRFGTGFTVSIEAVEGVTTGISAFDRAHTIRTATRPDASAADLAKPGHVFPIIARDGGVLSRVGQTEGSVDLAKLCGCKVPAGVICEIMNDDGTMARMPQLEAFSEKFNMPIVTVADIIAYRLRHECGIQKIKEELIEFGHAQGFKIVHLFDEIGEDTHVALIFGDTLAGRPLVRVHRNGGFSEIWNACTAHSPQSAIDKIRRHGCGVLLCLNQEKGLTDDEEINRPDPQTRTYGLGARLLRSLGISSMDYLTDTPKSLIGLDAFGLHIENHIAF